MFCKEMINLKLKLKKKNEYNKMKNELSFKYSGLLIIKRMDVNNYCYET